MLESHERIAQVDVRGHILGIDLNGTFKRALGIFKFAVAHQTEAEDIKRRIGGRVPN